MLVQVGARCPTSRGGGLADLRGAPVAVHSQQFRRVLRG